MFQPTGSNTPSISIASPRRRESASSACGARIPSRRFNRPYGASRQIGEGGDDSITDTVDSNLIYGASGNDTIAGTGVIYGDSTDPADSGSDVITGTGMRPHEVFALLLEDIHLDAPDPYLDVTGTLVETRP